MSALAILSRDSPVSRIECLITAAHLTLVGLNLGVDANMDLEAVGCQECLVAALLRALETVVACNYKHNINK